MTATRAWLLRAGLSVALLGAVAIILDPAAVAARLTAFHPGWVAAGLVLTAVQVAVSAWRWRFTAHRLGVPLPYPLALREYLLGGFLNQILPGGVLGDISRAWRHARGTAATGPAVRAVVVERGSGQVVMALIALPALLSLAGVVPAQVAWTSAGVMAAALLLTAPLLPAAPPPGPTGVIADARRALLAPDALPWQLLGSAAVVATYLAVFIAGARAIGSDVPTLTLLPLIPAVLLAMLIPITIAGWGLREGAAAVVWAAAGLDPAEGAAIALAYGLLVLLGALPGAACLTRLPRPPGNHRRTPRTN